MMRSVYLLLVVSSLVYGADDAQMKMNLLGQGVSLPSEATLQQYINSVKVNGAPLPPQFDELTRLSYNLVQQGKYVGDVLIYVTCAIETYNMKLASVPALPAEDKATASQAIRLFKPHIIKSILHEQNELIAKLEAYDLLQ